MLLQGGIKRRAGVFEDSEGDSRLSLPVSRRLTSAARMKDAVDWISLLFLQGNECLSGLDLPAMDSAPDDLIYLE
jgi:hypothetical protein